MKNNSSGSPLKLQKWHPH